jgi:ribosomal protein S18 acetylase RimI-like enzyme
MQLVSLHEKHDIEPFLRHNLFAHLFEYSDLDDQYWPYTIWFGLQEGRNLRQVALLYTGLPTPVLMANADRPYAMMADLLQRLVPLLPRRVYAHMHPAHVEAIAADFAVTPRGMFDRMGLRDASRLWDIDTSRVDMLAESDIPALEALYRVSYPDSSFRPQLVRTGWYYGIRHGSAIMSAAGVHVCAPAYKVAALGNVTTHPSRRGRGLSRAVCARLCQALLHHGVEHIGLSVKTDNASAITCYTTLGFEKIREHGAYILEWKR